MQCVELKRVDPDLRQTGAAAIAPLLAVTRNDPPVVFCEVFKKCRLYTN